MRSSISLSVCEQSDHLLATLATAVADLTPEEDAPLFDERFLVDFGFSAEFRSEIEEAFLWMLNQVLGDRDAHATEEAWTDFLATLTYCESLELVGV